MLINTRKLGLAAYIVLHGGIVVNVFKKTYTLNTDKSEEDWELIYQESCCKKHDEIVCNLRTRAQNHVC